MPEVEPSSHKAAGFLTGLACVFACGIASAGDASFPVWAIGLPHGYIVMERQDKVIEVTQKHVAQGFVPVPAATVLIVSTRAPGDYALHFAPEGTLFRSVLIDGGGCNTELPVDGGTVILRIAQAGKTVVAVNYRFQLAAGTVPGIYVWPLRLIAGTGSTESRIMQSRSF